MLIVGLGNPGAEYARHRHNAGFRVVEAFARIHGMSFSRWKRAKAYAASGLIDGRPILLAKPQTYMNQSGVTVSRLARAEQIPPERIMVVYDELDLPLGRLRLRPEGGAGGHRGMRSIIALLGTQQFARLRVGIDRPPGRQDPADYVLQPFDRDEICTLEEAVSDAVAALECWLSSGILAAMDRFNRPLSERATEQVAGIEAAFTAAGSGQAVASRAEDTPPATGGTGHGNMGTAAELPDRQGEE